MLALVAQVPSRAHLKRPDRVRGDLADNLIRLYNALWRHAHARGTARYRLTWGQLLAAAGYEERTYDPAWFGSLRSYVRLFEEAGLVRMSGRDELADGRTCVVTLLAPPGGLESAEDGRRSSAGQPTCEARRRTETRSQRAAWRERPYVHKGGRGRARQRWSFFWGPEVASQGVHSPSGSEHEKGSARVHAIEPRSGVDVGAALDELRTAAATGGAEALIAAAEAGAPPAAVAIAGWELLIAPWLASLGRETAPRLSHKRRRQLVNACASIDRTQGRPGAGLVHLVEVMGVCSSDLQFFDPERADRREWERVPASLGYFVVMVRQSSRRWRRHWRLRRAMTDRATAGSASGARDA